MLGGTLLSLITVLVLVEPRGQEALVLRTSATTGLIRSGFAAFRTPDAPPIAPELTKPLLRVGRLDPGYFIVHFRSAISAADEAWLDELAPGRTARLTLASDAVVLWVDDLGTWLALQRSARAVWVGRHQPAYKLDTALVLDSLAERPLLLAVELIPGHSPALVSQALEALGARCRGPLETQRLIVEALPRVVPELAHVEGIYRLWEEPDLDRSGGGWAATPEPESSSEKLGAPMTLTLGVTAGWDSEDGTLSSAKVGRLRSSDNSRFALHDEEELTLAFDASVPPGAVVSAIRLYVEHHEEARVDPGDILWKLAHGPLTDPDVVRTYPAPLRIGESLERLDAWAPDRLVPDPNDLKIVVENEHERDDTLLDRVYVEIDYLPPDLAPRITSTPNSSCDVGRAYGYDADGRAEASGAPPITWGVVSAPAGFAIQATTGAASWTPNSAGSYSISIRASNAHGTETQVFTVAVRGEEPLPPTLLPSNSSAIVYCPPERLGLGSAKAQQKLNVFLPRGAAPSSGWPVVLNNRAGGGIAAVPLGSLSDTGGTAPLHAFVASGVAVVDFGVTGIGNGQGLFYPPGHSSGRYESFRPADDNPEKEAEWALQWLKTQSAFPLDENRICLRGSSHGAIISIWAAMGPDRRRASGSPQVRASTRVKAVLALQPATSVWAFDQSSDLAIRMLAHFEQQARPGVPATAFGQVAPELQKDASILRFAFASAETRANNAAQALCLLYAEPVMKVGGAPADMTLDAQGFPNLHDTLRQPYIHDSWAGYVLYKRLLDLSSSSAAFHAAHSVFAVRSSIALPPPLNYHTRTYDGVVTGSEAAALAHGWVLETLGVTGTGF